MTTMRYAIKLAAAGALAIAGCGSAEATHAAPSSGGTYPSAHAALSALGAHGGTMQGRQLCEGRHR
jgi:DNA-binding transcriptional regulator LsrR (DeoR family)